MARFLVATMPVPGHVAPVATIVRALVQDGHAVVWYTSRFFQQRVEASGARFVPISSTLDYGDSDYDRHFPDRHKYSGLAQIKYDFKHVFIDAVPGYVHDMEAILEDTPIDVIVGDPAVAAGRVVGERYNLPWALINITVLGLQSRDVAPFGLALMPDSSPLGRVRNAALYWLADNVVFRDVNQHFARVAKQEHFEPYPFRPTVSPYLYLQPTVPSFEYPRSDLQPSVHFIGPILPDPLRDFTPPAWWSDVTSAKVPVVVVTQGTIATNPEDLLLPTLRALADQPVLVVATTGGKAPADLAGRLPANARVETFIPFGELLPHADLLVTNGGYGGVTLAMTNGVPVVASGISEDKAEVGNRVRAAGIGVSLKAAQPTETQIAQAVKTVLGDPKYRAAARRLQAECATYDAPRLAATLLDELARTGQPVLRGQPLPAVAH